MNKQTILKQKLASLELAQLQLEANINQMEIEWEAIEKEIERVNYEIESHNALKELFGKIILP